MFGCTKRKHNYKCYKYRNAHILTCILCIQSGSGLNECEQVLAANGGVCCLCIDNVNGAYVAGVQQFIRYLKSSFNNEIVIMFFLF